MNAEFFDIFGFIGFAILFFCATRILKSKDKSIRKYGVIILIISIIGLIVDGIIVTKTYIIG
ncbi:hypothetical protein KJ763_03240 [Patescibacteria group bacterium]|nr:hypothetical protein [Patescibacteria group bacterium]